MEGLAIQTLGETISKHLLYLQIGHKNILVLHVFPDEGILIVDVLCSLVELRMTGGGDGSCVISEQAERYDMVLLA